MTGWQHTPGAHEDPFAPRTPYIIGRQACLDAIRAALKDRGRRSHVFYFVGPGGSGKTRLLEEIEVIERTWEQRPFRCSGIIDLYHTDYHSPYRLLQAIAEGLDPEGRYFRKYHQQRVEFERRRREGSSVRELENLRHQLDQVFQKEYAALARKYRLVLCFDTLELIQYESDVLQEVCQVQDIDTVIKNWLLEQVGRLPKTVSLFAGRPHPKVQADFAERFSQAGCTFHVFELDTFTVAEARAYLAAMSDKRSELTEILTPEVQEWLFYITGRRPIYLSLLIDLLLHGEVIADIFPPDLTQNDDVQAAVGKRLVEHLLHLPDPFGQIIYFLMLARKGLDAELLGYLMRKTWTPAQIREYLPLMPAFAFIKTRPETAQLFLHDEVYDLFDRYFGNEPRYGHEYEAIARYYRKRLESVVTPREREDVMVALLYYELQVNAATGYHHYYARWDDEAIATHEIGFDLRLRDEVLRFIDRYAEPDSPFYVSRVVRQIDPMAIERDSAVRWIRRYLALGDYSKARYVAENLYASTHPIFNWDLVEDALYKADLLNIWGQVLVHSSAPEADSRTCLERAVQLLTAVQTGDEEQRWRRSRILGQAHNYLGYLYRICGRYGPALEEYKRALPYFNAAAIRDERANTLNNLAFLLAVLGRVNLALLHIRNALDIRQEIGHKYRLALSRNTRGIIYTLYDHPMWGVRECSEALGMCRELQEPRGIGLASIGLGFALRKRGEHWKVDAYSIEEAESYFAEAVQHLERAVDIFSEQVPEPVRLWEAYNELGSLYCDWGLLSRQRYDDAHVMAQYDLSVDYQRKALEIAEQYVLQSQTADSYDDLAQILNDRSLLLLHMHQPEEARRSREEAEQYLDRVVAMVPVAFHLMSGEGFGKAPEPGEAYWRALGKVHLWRGRWIFQHLELGVVPDPQQGRDGALRLGTRQLILAAAYFQRYWPPSFALEQTLSIFGDSLQSANVSSAWANEQIRAIAQEYRIDLTLVAQAVSDILGL